MMERVPLPSSLSPGQIVMCRPTLRFSGIPVLLAAVLAGAVRGEGDLDRPASWSPPAPAAIRERMVAWIDSRSADAASRARARKPWEWQADAAVPADLLDAATASIAAVDPRVAALQADLSADTSWLLDASPAADGADAFARDAVRLWVARQLVRQHRFDEALPLLEGLDVRGAIDPAAVLFHRAACRAWLLQGDAAIDDIDRLLERAGEIPVRYERTARLLRADMAALEDESLDHIARRMRDITRRLDLGHAGPKTRSVQDGVIASLDKLIKKIEDQQSQSQSQSSSGAGGSGEGGSAAPMDDSRIAGGKGPGEVRNRDLGSTDGWGKLPPHERDEVLQQIGREFPAHYREAIEQYFKRLAAGGDDR